MSHATWSSEGQNKHIQATAESSNVSIVTRGKFMTCLKQETVLKWGRQSHIDGKHSDFHHICYWEQTCYAVQPSLFLCLISLFLHASDSLSLSGADRLVQTIEGLGFWHKCYFLTLVSLIISLLHFSDPRGLWYLLHVTVSVCLYSGSYFNFKIKCVHTSSEDTDIHILYIMWYREELMSKWSTM